MLQITMINAFSPYYPKDADDSIQIKDDRFDRTMELIRCRVIKELHAYPQAHIDRFRQEFIDDILVDGYPDKEKLNVELVSKSGIHYFVVDGRCFPTESIKEELKRESNDTINHNLKVRRKNMRCTKAECDMAKAFAGAFKEIVEDNKRMKDALLVFSQYLQGKFSQIILLDCNDEAVNELINIVGSGIRKLKQEGNGKSE